jgi:hypothetical protein
LRISAALELFLLNGISVNWPYYIFVPLSEPFDVVHKSSKNRPVHHILEVDSFVCQLTILMDLKRLLRTKLQNATHETHYLSPVAQKALADPSAKSFSIWSENRTHNLHASRLLFRVFVDCATGLCKKIKPKVDDFWRQTAFKICTGFKMIGAAARVHEMCIIKD